jgi:hypothetical protein
MNDFHNGGAAFPAEITVLIKDLNADVPETDLRTTTIKQGGMTLRDYFAAKAMQAFCSNIKTSFQEDAELAYRMADAMLEARK